MEAVYRSEGVSLYQADYGTALTVRERGVLHLLARGYSAREIAQRLRISERTSGFHLGNVYRKLGVNSNVRAIRRGLQKGLIDLCDLLEEEDR